MDTNYKEMKELKEWRDKSVDRMNSMNSELDTNQKKIATDIDSLKTKFGSRFGSDETSDVSRWEAANTVEADDDATMKTKNEERYKKWQDVFDLNWHVLDEVADGQEQKVAANDLKETLEDDDTTTYGPNIKAQEEILEEIKAQDDLYTKYDKYGFETEGATASAAGYMAAIFVSAFAALI